jgi:hypothetical protein
VGTLPFDEHLQVTVSNLYTGERRRIDARIDVFTAGGLSLANWKSGSQVLDPGEVFSIGFDQVIPRRITTGVSTPSPLRLRASPPHRSTSRPTRPPATWTARSAPCRDGWC